MAGEIQPQAELGTFTLAGLSTFKEMLAILSADDVAPLAVIELEQLGSMFHINGPYAQRVPDLLQRCSSTKMERLGLVLGWRKDDTASIFQKTAGGQTVSMLCFCLSNVCWPEKCGEILYDLCEKLLPRQSLLSSIGQMSKVATVLFSKLSCFGYGNALAEQVLRIQKTYEQLNLPIPKDFFDEMTRESAVELLSAICSAFGDESCHVRISGTRAMGHIATMCSMMFPEDTVISVEGFLIQQGTRQSISIMLNSQTSEVDGTQIQVETLLKGSPSQWLPLRIEPNEPNERNGLFRKSIRVPYRFAWSRHVADALRLAFATVGTSCSEQLLVACSKLVIAVGPTIKLYVNQYGQPLPSRGLFALLGREPLNRLLRTCHSLLGVVSSSDYRADARSALKSLNEIFENTVGSVHTCNCTVTACDRSLAWSSTKRVIKSSNGSNCIPLLLWSNIGSAISRVLFSSLVDVEDNVAVEFDINELPDFAAEMSDSIFVPGGSLQCQDLHTNVFRLIKPIGFFNALAASNESCTIYPQTLRDFRVDFDNGYLYDICDGCLFFKHNYFDLLQCIGKPRQAAVKSLFNQRSDIPPSSAGGHSNINFTIIERAQALQLRTNIIAQGQVVDLDLFSTLMAAMGLEESEGCEHSVNSKLLNSTEDVIFASVAAPEASGQDQIAIVQTKGDKTAQLLACCEKTRPLLQRISCLNCAVAQARRERRRQVIVGI